MFKFTDKELSKTFELADRSYEQAINLINVQRALRSPAIRSAIESMAEDELPGFTEAGGTFSLIASGVSIEVPYENRGMVNLMFAKNKSKIACDHSSIQYSVSRELHCPDYNAVLKLTGWMYQSLSDEDQQLLIDIGKVEIKQETTVTRSLTCAIGDGLPF